ncbi:hypothetical protein [Aquifex aeolicus]|uniref:Uncharacterized protein aq_577 n=1 Tax=Aquifex aeolicus (strain VF5) TaxID=224324 RepID=Y577_AQUAE|nr:hypothetical protein [Aquifex aeolicus]O66845.1 RecName: Full=Uncharacterized protein aq_577 [Aquifex aeolicus VF5]AAC06805.1 putative protein [Aquifex aeolicus VF5]
MVEVLRSSTFLLLRNWEFTLAWIVFFTIPLVITPLPYVGFLAFFFILLFFNSTTQYFVKVLSKNEKSLEIKEIFKIKKPVFSFSLGESVYLFFTALLYYLFTKFYAVLFFWWWFYKPFLEKELYYARTFEDGFKALLILLLRPNWKYIKLGLRWSFIGLVLLTIAVLLVLSIAGVLLASFVVLLLSVVLAHFTAETILRIKTLA